MDIIELKIVPIRQMFYSDATNYGIYSCEPAEKTSKVEINRYGNFSVKGNTVRLTLDKEYNAKLTQKTDKKYGVYYEIVSIFEDMPTDIKKQRSYLLTLLTETQVKEIYNVYPDTDIIQLIKEDKFDYNKVKGIGKKTYLKIKDRIIENLEFQQAYDFLSDYGVTNNLIIKLVKHFKSASLLIKKMKDNPYSITEVSGVGYKKADAIAMSMGYDPSGEFRIVAAIQYVVEEESNAGHTYCEIDKVVDSVYEMIGVDESTIAEQIKDTDSIITVGERLALKKNYNAEKYIAKRLKELTAQSQELNFNVETFIQEQEEKLGIQLTDQQKSLYYNIKNSMVTLLVGFAGTGKSFNVQMLITLLEKLNIGYRLLSPTGKAAKILSNYTGREAETIHRAIGMGQNEHEEPRYIEEEFVIVDEASMVDIQLGAKLLSRCKNEKLRLLFIGDPFQLPSVSAGNLLHDMIESKQIPMTMLDIVFRQKEGGILDIATKIRKNERFLSNDEWGIKEFGNNCIVACVPQDKIEGGYKYYFNKLIEEYGSDDVTITTPTKKSNLGTVEINKTVQEIVNPNENGLPEKKYGFNEVKFRVDDLVLNTVNSYRMLDIDENEVSIVNGDVGKVIKVDLEEEEIHVDFGFAIIPFPFSKLGQLLHCWGMTIHKMQGSSNRAIVVILDKAHKFQSNANLLYTAVTRSVDYLVILSQAETINFAMRKVANLQRNTFLKEMLVKGEYE